MDNTKTRQDVLDFEERVRKQSIATMHRIVRDRNTLRSDDGTYKKTSTYKTMLGN